MKLRVSQQGDWDLLERMGMLEGDVLWVEESIQVNSAEFGCQLVVQILKPFPSLRLFPIQGRQA